MRYADTHIPRCQPWPFVARRKNKRLVVRFSHAIFGRIQQVSALVAAARFAEVVAAVEGPSEH
jgi:hypothetical protein